MKLIIFLLTLIMPFCAMSKPIEILAVGDSLIHGYTLPEMETFPAQLQRSLIEKGYDVVVYNEGVSGETSEETAARMQGLLDKYPNLNLVILVTGANDIFSGEDPNVFLDSLDRGLEKCLKTISKRNIKIFIGGMKSPLSLGLTNGAAVVSIYKSLAKEYDAALYPFFLENVWGAPEYTLGDGIHPNKFGVELIVRNVSPIIEKQID